jgi:hypothetical protein
MVAESAWPVGEEPDGDVGTCLNHLIALGLADAPEDW